MFRFDLDGSGVISAADLQSVMGERLLRQCKLERDAFSFEEVRNHYCMRSAPRSPTQKSQVVCERRAELGLCFLLLWVASSSLRRSSAKGCLPVFFASCQRKTAEKCSPW